MSSDVRSSIVTWLHMQPFWVQQAAKKILSNEEVTEKYLIELFECLKSEDGQMIGSLVDFSFFSSIVDYGFVLKIKSIGDIQGIDDLAPKAPLSFGDNLSVLYGNNGSGKSGYTRILKKACGKVNAIDLIPNVFKETPALKKCSISFEVNGESSTEVWVANSKSISQLHSVDVFDSLSEGTYLNGETDSTYTPIEVLLFEKLVGVFDALRFRLEKAASVLNSKLPQKPSEFAQSQFIEHMYNHLKHDADIEKLKKFYEYQVTDDEKLKSLEERIKTAPSVLAKKKTQTRNQITSLLEAISNSSNYVSQTFCDEVATLREDVEAKKKTSTEAAKVLSENSKIQGVGEETWKSMWFAAKKFSEDIAYQEISFPNTDTNSVCILCHQELSDSAKTRMLGFNDFVKGQLQADFQNAEQLYQQKLDSLPLIPNEDSLKTTIQACQLDETKWLPIILQIWSNIKSVKMQLLERKDGKVKGSSYEKSILAEIENFKTKLDEEISTHNKDNESFDLNKLQRDLIEIKAKKWASSYVPSMIEEITRLKGLNQISIWGKLVSTNSLSKKAGEISEKILTEAYVERFNKELMALGANKISVELIKSKIAKGKVKHKLQLKNVNQDFSKLQLTPLSDGEKRVVSLAAFLADVMGRTYKAPFVFDDPISSLDQIYEEKSAQRLIELSKDRQVIVFTHRLSLLSLLGEAENVQEVHIRREYWGCGEHGDIPLFGKKPIGAIKVLKMKKLADAKRLLKDKGIDCYNDLAKSICSELRILLERIIEHELLSGIVQRHQRGLVTKGKLGDLIKIQKQDCELLEGLMTEYSKYEHSQSMEAPNELPNPTTIEKDLDAIISWHTDFSKRPTP